jgi:septal ring factor EnvC (AmiA/AmiB activator)
VLNNIDIYIAAALFLVMAIVFVGTRVGVMPRKSIPVVAGAVFGALGLGIFAAWRRRAADAQIEELKKRIAKRDQDLEELMRKRKFADEELAAARASLNNQLAAVSVQRQGIAENLAAEQDRIAKLPATEVHDELTRLLQEEASFQRRSGGVKPQE